MPGDRGACGEQFFDHDEAGEGTAADAAIFLGEGKAEITGLPQLAAEGGVETLPGSGAAVYREVGDGFLDQGAQGWADCLILGRQGGKGQCFEQADLVKPLRKWRIDRVL